MKKKFFFLLISFFRLFQRSRTISLCVFLLFHTFSYSQSWTQKANFDGTARYWATGFSIGNKGYIGTGFDAGWRKDFWEWNQVSDTWTQKADFGGTARYQSVSFSIGTKGYIGTGFDNTNSSKQDFWEWDGDVASPNYNTWTQKANFGGAVRYGAVGFSIGTKGYIGTGSDVSGAYMQDFWEWDQVLDTWTAKANFGGTARWEAVGFSIGTKGYIGTGSSYGTSQIYYKDFWEWDQSNNIWTSKTNFGGTARFGAVGFSIGTKGYIGTGMETGTVFKKDFWEWDQGSNVWSQKANLGTGTERYDGVGFSIGAKGYIGTGNGAANKKDFWEYSSVTGAVTETDLENSIVIYPNPFIQTAILRIMNPGDDNYDFTLYDVHGNKIKEEIISDFSSFVLRRDNLPDGIYFVNIKTEAGTVAKKIVISQ